MKTFLAPTVYFAAAARALGEPERIGYVDVITVADGKPAIRAIADEAGLEKWMGENIQFESRVNDTEPLVRDLRAAGLIPTGVAAMYVTDSALNHLILRLEPDGTFTRYAERLLDPVAGTMVVAALAPDDAGVGVLTIPLASC